MMHLFLCTNSTCKGLAAAIDTLVFTEDRNGATCALKVPHFASRSIVHHFTAGVNQRHCKFVAASAHCFFKEYTCMYVCVCMYTYVSISVVSALVLCALRSFPAITADTPDKFACNYLQKCQAEEQRRLDYLTRLQLPWRMHE